MLAVVWDVEETEEIVETVTSTGAEDHQLRVARKEVHHLISNQNSEVDSVELDVGKDLVLHHPKCNNKLL